MSSWHLTCQAEMAQRIIQKKVHKMHMFMYLHYQHNFYLEKVSCLEAIPETKPEETW